MARKYKYKVTTTDNLSCGNITTKYRLHYNKGTKVYSRASTLGVMTFRRRKDAENFIQTRNSSDLNKIKRVLPIGRGKTPKFIACASLDYFYEDKEMECFDNHIVPPPGTICYPGVYVCD